MINNFLLHCVMAGFKDQWDAYRNEPLWPNFLKESHDAYIKKLHEFYILRDGPNGFLGGKGL